MKADKNNWLNVPKPIDPLRYISLDEIKWALEPLHEETDNWCLQTEKDGENNHTICKRLSNGDMAYITFYYKTVSIDYVFLSGKGIQRKAECLQRCYANTNMMER